jgi:hypothetical protein
MSPAYTCYRGVAIMEKTSGALTRIDDLQRYAHTPSPGE